MVIEKEEKKLFSGEMLCHAKVVLPFVGGLIVNAYY